MSGNHLPCPAFLTSCRWTTFTSANAEKQLRMVLLAVSRRTWPVPNDVAWQYSDADVATCDSRCSAVIDRSSC